MALTCKDGVFTTFEANLMTDRIDFPDLGFVPFFTVKVHGKWTVYFVRLVFGDFFMKETAFLKVHSA